MEKRIKIRHAGPRGWAGIAASAFDPSRHERYAEAGAKAEDDMQALRAEYQRVVGKRPFMGWDAAKLTAEIVKHTGGAD